MKGHPYKSVFSLLLGVVFSTGLSPMGWGTSVSDSTIRTKVLQYIHHTITMKPGEVMEVEILRVPGRSFDFSDTEDQIKLELSSSLEENFTNRGIVHISMKGPGGEKREIGVPVKISIKKPVWVVSHRVSAGDTLSFRDFELKDKEVSQVYKTVVGREKDLSQYVARVNLQPGELLDNRKIIHPPAIRRNSDVYIILTNGSGLNISIPGMALEDGQIGETIRVRQQMHKSKYYLAKVIAKNRVQVEI